MTPSDFAQYDVVITTYGTLSAEYMPRGKATKGKNPPPIPRKNGLYSVNWRRVVLDEGVSAYFVLLLSRAKRDVSSTSFLMIPQLGFAAKFPSPVLWITLTLMHSIIYGTPLQKVRSQPRLSQLNLNGHLRALQSSTT